MSLLANAYAFPLNGLLAAILVLIAPTVAATPAATDRTAETKDFHVPAGEAVTTLKLFASQSGREVMFPVEPMTGVTTNAIRGTYTPRQALDRLAAGTGLFVVEDPISGALMITRDNPANRYRGQEPQAIIEPDSSLQPHPPVNETPRRTPLAAFIGWLGISLATASPLSAAESGPDQDDVVAMEEFRVYSDSRGLALEAQRKSDRISSTLSTDALGDMPDGSIGTALNRLPGVNIVGGRATIRGAEGKLNSVQLDGDGLSFASTDLGTSRGSDNRGFDVNSIPIEAIREIEVIKSLTPDLDADSVGGLVNLKTVNAFDTRMEGFRYKLEYTYNDYDRTNSKRGSVSYARVLNEAATFGLVLNLTYGEGKSTGSELEKRYTNLPPLEADGTPKVPRLQDFGPRYSQTKNDRITASASLDWKFSPTTVLYFKPWYQHRTDDFSTVNYRYRGLDTTRDRVVLDDFRVQGGEFRMAKVYRDRPNRIREDYRLALGGETVLDRSKLEYAFSYGENRNRSDRQRQITFDTPSNDPVLGGSFRHRRGWMFVVDNSNLFPTIEVVRRATDGAIPPAWAFLNVPPGTNYFDTELSYRGLINNEVRYQNVRANDSNLTGKVDYQIDLDGGANPISVKFGGRLRKKDRDSRSFIEDWTPNHAIAPQSISEWDFPFDGKMDAFKGRYADQGVPINREAMEAFFLANRNLFIRNDGRAFNTNAAKTYDASETISGLYGMGTMRWVDFTLIGGVRYEHTQNTYTWRASEITPPDPSFARLSDLRGRKSYDNFFPSLVGVYRLSDHVLRAAYSTTIARPDYETLVPFDIRIMREAWGRSTSSEDVDVGNPGLTEQTARNYDIAWEYYWGDDNNLSVGLFHKELKNFIFSYVTQNIVFIPEDPSDPNSPLNQEVVRSARWENGSKQEITGIELSWTQSLRNLLPAPFDGFRLVANYTYIRGSEVLPVFNEATGSRVGERTAKLLTGQPKNIYNLQLYYEKGPVSTRFAYNYIDSLKTNVFEQFFPIIDDKNVTLDASIQYRLNRRVRLFLDVNNITENDSLRYNTIKAFPERYNPGVRTWVFGMRGSF